MNNEDNEYKKIIINHIETLIKRIEDAAISSVDKIIYSDALPEHWKNKNYEMLLAMAILDTICRDRPFKPVSVKNQKEFDNIYKFL